MNVSSAPASPIVNFGVVPFNTNPAAPTVAFILPSETRSNAPSAD